jgi:hypothetical protein
MQCLACTRKLSLVRITTTQLHIPTHFHACGLPPPTLLSSPLIEPHHVSRNYQDCLCLFVGWRFTMHLRALATDIANWEITDPEDCSTNSHMHMDLTLTSSLPLLDTMSSSMRPDFTDKHPGDFVSQTSPMHATYFQQSSSRNIFVTLMHEHKNLAARLSSILIRQPATIV